MERPVDWKVEDANSPPVALEKISLSPDEFSILKRLATWLSAARIVSGILLVDVASIVTCELPIGVVVPKVDGVVVPETAPASCANDALEIRWRGERVSEESLSSETST